MHFIQMGFRCYGVHFCWCMSIVHVSVLYYCICICMVGNLYLYATVILTITVVTVPVRIYCIVWQGYYSLFSRIAANGTVFVVELLQLTSDWISRSYVFLGRSLVQRKG